MSELMGFIIFGLVLSMIVKLYQKTFMHRPHEAHTSPTIHHKTSGTFKQFSKDLSSTLLNNPEKQLTPKSVNSYKLGAPRTSPSIMETYPGRDKLTGPTDTGGYPYIKKLTGLTKDGNYPGIKKLTNPTKKHPTLKSLTLPSMEKRTGACSGLLGKNRLQRLIPNRYKTIQQATIIEAIFRSPYGNN